MVSRSLVIVATLALLVASAAAVPTRSMLQQPEQPPPEQPPAEQPPPEQPPAEQPPPEQPPAEQQPPPEQPPAEQQPPPEQPMEEQQPMEEPGPFAKAPIPQECQMPNTLWGPTVIKCAVQCPDQSYDMACFCRQASMQQQQEGEQQQQEGQEEGEEQEEGQQQEQQQQQTVEGAFCALVECSIVPQIEDVQGIEEDDDEVTTFTCTNRFFQGESTITCDEAQGELEELGDDDENCVQQRVNLIMNTWNPEPTEQGTVAQSQ